MRNRAEAETPHGRFDESGMEKNLNQAATDLVDMGFTASEADDFKAFGFTDEEIKEIDKIMKNK